MGLQKITLTYIIEPFYYVSIFLFLLYLLLHVTLKINKSNRYIKYYNELDKKV